MNDFEELVEATKTLSASSQAPNASIASAVSDLSFRASIQPSSRIFLMRAALFLKLLACLLDQLPNL